MAGVAGEDSSITMISPEPVDDDHGREEKKRKFKPFEKMRKLFRVSKKQKKGKDEGVRGLKARSTSELRSAQADSEDTDDDGGFKSRLRLSQTRSISEDSVFTADPKDKSNIRSMKSAAASTEALNKSALASELLNKIKNRNSYQSDDDGLPISPKSSFTTADIILGGGLKTVPGWSASRESDKSLLSMDEDEEEDPFRANWRASVPIVTKSPIRKSDSTYSKMDVDLGAVETTKSLSSVAARHKIAVKPKARRASTKLRGQRLSSSSPLPSLNEESPSKISLASTKNESITGAKSGKKENIDVRKLKDTSAHASSRHSSPVSPPPASSPKPKVALKPQSPVQTPEKTILDIDKELASEIPPSVSNKYKRKDREDWVLPFQSSDSAKDKTVIELESTKIVSKSHSMTSDLESTKIVSKSRGFTSESESTKIMSKSYGAASEIESSKVASKSYVAASEPEHGKVVSESYGAASEVEPSKIASKSYGAASRVRKEKALSESHEDIGSSNTSSESSLLLSGKSASLDKVLVDSASVKETQTLEADSSATELSKVFSKVKRSSLKKVHTVSDDEAKTKVSLEDTSVVKTDSDTENKHNLDAKKADDKSSHSSGNELISSTSLSSRFNANKKDDDGNKENIYVRRIKKSDVDSLGIKGDSSESFTNEPVSNLRQNFYSKHLKDTVETSKSEEINVRKLSVEKSVSNKSSSQESINSSSSDTKRDSSNDSQSEIMKKDNVTVTEVSSIKHMSDVSQRTQLKSVTKVSSFESKSKLSSTLTESSAIFVKKVQSDSTQIYKSKEPELNVETPDLKDMVSKDNGLHESDKAPVSHVKTDFNNKLSSPKEEYKQRRQARSKTLPEKLSVDMLSKSANEQSSPEKTENKESPPTETKDMLSPDMTAATRRASTIIPASRRPEPKRLSIKVGGGDNTSSSEPAWVVMARRRQEDHEDDGKTDESKVSKVSDVSKQTVDGKTVETSASVPTKKVTETRHFSKKPDFGPKPSPEKIKSLDRKLSPNLEFAKSQFGASSADLSKANVSNDENKTTVSVGSPSDSSKPSFHHSTTPAKQSDQQTDQPKTYTFQKPKSFASVKPSYTSVSSTPPAEKPVIGSNTSQAQTIKPSATQSTNSSFIKSQSLGRGNTLTPTDGDKKFGGWGSGRSTAMPSTPVSNVVNSTAGTPASSSIPTHISIGSTSPSTTSSLTTNKNIINTTVSSDKERRAPTVSKLGQKDTTTSSSSDISTTTTPSSIPAWRSNLLAKKQASSDKPKEIQVEIIDKPVAAVPSLAQTKSLNRYSVATDKSASTTMTSVTGSGQLLDRSAVTSRLGNVKLTEKKAVTMVEKTPEKEETRPKPPTVILREKTEKCAESAGHRHSKVLDMVKNYQKLQVS